MMMMKTTEISTSNVVGREWPSPGLLWPVSSGHRRIVSPSLSLSADYKISLPASTGQISFDLCLEGKESLPFSAEVC